MYIHLKRLYEMRIDPAQTIRGSGWVDVTEIGLRQDNRNKSRHLPATSQTQDISMHSL